MVAADYQHIWDCCCDHGLLGASLLTKDRQHNTRATIHFVDIVPELMHTLSRKLNQFYPLEDYNWQTHCLDVTQLPLKDFQGKHLVIIAGVGGDLMMRFIDTIIKNHPNTDIDFLLCPVHHQFALRKLLRSYQFSLKRESLIEENKRFYEILLVSNQSNKNAEISPTGKAIWQADSKQQAVICQNYLEKTLAHYQRIELGGNNLASEAIKVYKTQLFNDQQGKPTPFKFHLKIK